MSIVKPELFNPEHFFNPYIKLAPKQDLKESLQYTEKEVLSYFDGLSVHDSSYRYADGKWTIKQVLQHINDTERVLSYRAFRISRKDTVNLVGFDQDQFAENDNSDSFSVEEIRNEFIAIRHATKLLFSKMNPAVIDFQGQASNLSISPRALGWIISGHTYHHLNVLKESYTVK